MAPAGRSVLLTAHRFHPHVGGTEAYVRQLARGLVRRGWSVTVATSREPDTPAQEDLDGVAVRRFDLRRVGRFRLPPPAFAKLVADPPADLVHLHGQRVWSSDHAFGRLRRTGGPAVFTPHGFYQWHVGRIPLLDAAYYRRWLPRRVRGIRRVVCLTGRERDEAASFGMDPQRLVVIPSGFDPDEFRDTPPAGFRQRHGLQDGPLLLYVGGFYPNKRVDRLVRAAAASDQRPQLVVIGKDPDPPRGARAAIGLARRLGVDLHVLGTLPRPEVRAAYAESDLFLLGSDFEGYGLVLLEAMAAGLPFVSTPAGAAPDLAATGAGRLADDAQGMGRAIRTLLADPPLRRSMAERGRRAAQGLDWDRCAGAHARLYEDVLGGR